jgi:polyisoprenoid-binding protein YceI
MMPRSFAVLAVLALASTASADTLKFSNAGSTAEFAVTKKGGTHAGKFKKFSGSVSLPGSSFAEARFAFDIETDSLHADNEKMTAYLKSHDVFDVHGSPTIRFVSNRIRVVSGDGFETHLILGELTAHGVTKRVGIPVQVIVTPSGLTMIGTLVVHRKDFGMNSGDKLLDDDVTITLRLQAGR